MVHYMVHYTVHYVVHYMVQTVHCSRSPSRGRSTASSAAVELTSSGMIYLQEKVGSCILHLELTLGS